MQPNPSSKTTILPSRLQKKPQQSRSWKRWRKSRKNPANRPSPNGADGGPWASRQKKGGPGARLFLWLDPIRLIFGSDRPDGHSLLPATASYGRFPCRNVEHRRLRPLDHPPAHAKAPRQAGISAALRAFRTGRGHKSPSASSISGSSVMLIEIFPTGDAVQRATYDHEDVTEWPRDEIRLIPYVLSHVRN